LHFIAELFRRPQFRPADVSIREFVTDHFGPDILNSVVEPLLSGVYGGDAASLSAVSVLPRFVEYERVYGSLIKGVRQEQSRQSERPSSLFLSFEGGMQTLVDALGESLQQTTDIRFAQVETVHQSREGWRLAVADGCIEAANVILACPAHVSARLLSTAAPVLANHLACISYSSAILITLVYERGSVHHPLDGFGFLVPQTERKSVAATTWISTKFPSRTPGHRCALRCFIVGRHATDLMDCSDAKLIETARNELEEKMGLAAIPLFTTVYRWPDSMPQYTVGHQERTSQILAELKRLNGLHLCGNAYDGVGIPDCIRLARQTANGIAAM
ncbi:MAG: protoporphyrinogen oxidase, partial [Acidobacteriaceae bacterium]|nr:protoporphyrinogen oxidase [Acidobacteriaceae bacterium]